MIFIFLLHNPQLSLVVAVFSSILSICTISKTSASVSPGHPNTRELMKARGVGMRAFLIKTAVMLH